MDNQKVKSEPIRVCLPECKLKESTVSRHIRILAEIEKIWILYDMTNTKSLNFQELNNYLKDMVPQEQQVDDDQLRKLFNRIDKNDNGWIDREEMFHFLESLLDQRKDLKFKGIHESVAYRDLLRFEDHK